MSPNGIPFNGIPFNGIPFNGIPFNGIPFNGIPFNGIPFNGIPFNGIPFNGIPFNGIPFNGITMGGISVGDIAVSAQTKKGENIVGVVVGGSVIVGVLADGKSVWGADLTGSTLKAKTKDGEWVFRVDSAYIDSMSKTVQDTFWYTVSYTGPDHNPKPLCLDEKNQPTGFTPFMGMAWNEQTGSRIEDKGALTLACKDGVIGKCAYLGYRPWATGTQCKGTGRGKRCTDISLKDHHQACTRMLRADYCGNGQPWTKDGTLIDVFDYLNPPIQLREENWQMESRWVPSGAICLSEERHPELGFPGYCVVDGRKSKLPACLCYEDNSGLIVSTFNDDPRHKK